MYAQTLRSLKARCNRCNSPAVVAAEGKVLLAGEETHALIRAEGSSARQAGMQAYPQARYTTQAVIRAA
eukprot:3304914-Pleurochrysis_carterae.AAC.4